MAPNEPSAFGSLPRPGRALKAVLLGMLGTWVAFAIGLNWASASSDVFLLFCGNTEKVLSGELWRLVTASFVHWPQGSAGFGHILTALLILYFLSPSLEARWGSGRFVRFLVLSGIIGYSIQIGVELLLPASAAARLTAAQLVGGHWFGSVPIGEAVAIAWALSFRGQQVRLMFVLPVSSTGLIVFVVAVSVLRVIAVAETFEGLIAPFGGMFAGWFLGAGTPSPARRLYLRFRLGQIERETARERDDRKRRVERSGLRVVRGGKDDDDGDSGPKMLH